jgi:N-acetylneuraminic acid mutarotase
MKKTISIVLVLALGLASASLATEDKWTTKAPMPTARLGFSQSVIDGEIYAIGGVKNEYEAFISTVEVYDPVTNTWTKKGDMPNPGRVFSTSVVDGIIYLFVERGQSVTVYAYNPKTDTWTEKANINTISISTGVVDGIIYIVTGDILTAYDPVMDTWTTKAPMPTGRGRFPISVVDGIIYAIGGVAPPNWWGLRTVEAYDPVTDTWTKKADMPTGRYSPSTSVVDGIIYAIGGWNNSASGPLYSKVEAYDPVTDTWTTKTDMPAARALLSTSVVDGKIYAIGGTRTTHPMTSTSTVYEYDPNPLVVDFNGDGIVDCADICMMIDNWHTDEPLYDIAPAPFGDGIIDVQDLILLSEHLFEEVFPPDLVAYWKLDEAEGDIAYNSIGDNHGILFGDPVWQSTEGIKDGALQFDGIDDYVLSIFDLNPADGPFSVFAWIKDGAPGQVIISQMDGNGSGETWLGIDPINGCLMTSLVPLPVGRFLPQPLESQFIITDDQWHHVGFVWDGSYRALYVDGAEVTKDTSPLAPLKYSNGGIYVGANKNLDAGTYFSGLIDEVRIYDVALTAEKIVALAQ